MGFTHYFYREPQLDEAKFKLFSEDVKAIFAEAKKLKIPLADAWGTKGTSPRADEKCISFNGVEEDGHETMHIGVYSEKQVYVKGDLAFGFCKTARKPYDDIVTAVLVAFKHHFPDAKISSDGENEDFNIGKEICLKLFGYGNDFKLRNEG